jgi:hypothetical protein
VTSLETDLVAKLAIRKQRRLFCMQHIPATTNRNTTLTMVSMFAKLQHVALGTHSRLLSSVNAPATTLSVLTTS